MIDKPAGPGLNLGHLLETLSDYQVDFVVVGGVAANLHGTTRATADCDIVVDQDAYNLRRLVNALEALRARPRTDAASVDEQNAATVADKAARGSGVHPAELQDGFVNVQTDAGPLDVLPHLEVGDSTYLNYRDLRTSSLDLEAQGSFVVKVASIEHLIMAKRHIDRPHDRADVAELSAITSAGPSNRGAEPPEPDLGV